MPMEMKQPVIKMPNGYKKSDNFRGTFSLRSCVLMFEKYLKINVSFVYLK